MEPLNVAEACSGLRMLTAFVIVAAVLAYVVNRPRWQKLVLIISSIPVAILCNIARVVVTALLFQVAGSDVAEKFFHDFAGWAMMPLAVLILVGELWIMSRLVIEDEGTTMTALSSFKIGNADLVYSPVMFHLRSMVNTFSVDFVMTTLSTSPWVGASFNVASLRHNEC